MASPRKHRLTDAPRFWLVLPAITLAVAFCNSEGGSGPGDSGGSAGGGNGGASSSTGSSSSTLTLVGSGAQTSTTGAGGGPEIPIADAGIPDGDLPPEPMMACDGASDAGGSDMCPLPPPVCAQDRWIIYYKNAECVEKLCHFEAFAYDCSPKTCIAGGCEYTFTAF